MAGANETSMSKAIELVQRATEEDSRKNYKEAITLYGHGCEYFMHALKCTFLGILPLFYSICTITDETQTERQREMVRNRVQDYIARAEKLKQHLDSNPAGENPVKEGDNSNDSDDNAANKKLQESLHKAIVVEKSNVSWNDIAGLDGAKEALKEAVILPIKFPHLFKGQSLAFEAYQ